LKLKVKEKRKETRMCVAIGATQDLKHRIRRDGEKSTTEREREREHGEGRGGGEGGEDFSLRRATSRSDTLDRESD
jgi:hypothetical protein